MTNFASSVSALAPASAAIQASAPARSRFYREPQIFEHQNGGGPHIGHSRPVRDRRRSGIRAFDLAHPVLAGEAAFDKIKLRASAVIGYASADQMEEYLTVVGDRSALLPGVFQVREGLSATTRTFVTAPHWLFTGSGCIKDVARASGGRAYLDLEININPTRFLAHRPEAFALADLEVIHPADALARSPDLRDQTCAATLNQSDNFLIGAWRRGSSCFDGRERWWQGVLGIYLAHVQALIDDALVPSWDNGLPRVQISNLEFDTVAQAEIYWEMETEDALAVVCCIADAAPAVAAAQAIRWYASPLAAMGFSTDVNCPVVTFPLTQDIDACIYAKTPDVVRFEMRYKKDIRGAVARGLCGSLGPLSILNLARQDAATRMNRITRVLTDVMRSEDFDPAAIWDFMDALYAAVGPDQVPVQRLHSALMNLGSVCRTPPGGIAPQPVIDRLLDRCIIQRVRARHGGTPKYALAPRYATMRRVMLAARRLPHVGSAGSTACERPAANIA